MAVVAAAAHVHHHHHHHHAVARWEQLVLAAIMGCILLLFLGITLFATLSAVVRRTETSAAGLVQPNSCLPNAYGSVRRQRHERSDNSNTDRAEPQYDGIFFDQDTYVDSGPPSPPSWVGSPDKEVGVGELEWSPVSSPQQALSTAIQQRLAILETELA